MKHILRLVTGAFAAALFALAARAAELAPGAFSAGTVKGDVSYKVAGSDTYAPVTPGLALPQGATIKTGAASTVSIVFSNGGSAAITANSEIEITKFEQELFSGPIAGVAEPSVSNTEIKVVNGTVVNKVAKLKKGSSYTVNSPVGAAGVRGTIFSVSFDKTTKKLSVSVTQGRVVFTPVSYTVEFTTFDSGKLITIEVNKTLTIESLEETTTELANTTLKGKYDIKVTDLNEEDRDELTASLIAAGLTTTETTNAAGQTVITVTDPTQVSTVN
jgi:FecR protein